MPSVYRIIKKKSEVLKLIEYCERTGYASFDFETNAHPINSSTFYPTIMGISFQPGMSMIIPLGHFDSPFKDNWLPILKLIGKRIFENKNIVKICQNLKFEYKILLKYGITMRGRLFDSMLAKYLLDEERPHGLKPMTIRFLPEFSDYESYEGSGLPWDEKPLDGLSKYCGIDCDVAFRLMLFFEKKLIRLNLYQLFRNMMMMATRVIAESEFRGIKVNRKYLQELDKKYRRKIADVDNEMRSIPKIKKFQEHFIKSRVKHYIEKIENEIEEIEESDKPNKDRLINNRKEKIDRLLVGDYSSKKEADLFEPLNFNSPDQLKELFYYSKKGFKFRILGYTKTGEPSTDESNLLKLKNKDKTGFIELLLKHRGLVKLHSTYIFGILEKLTEDNRIHASFNLWGTVTGRLSSNNPNLQNIPRGTTASDIKKMFIPDEGTYLFQLDYSQAELRVMAAQAGEKEMIRWFKIGRDIHLATACDKENWSYDKRLVYLNDENHEKHIETKKSRKKAKTINFGIIYGQGDEKLGEGMEISTQEAKKYKNDYFSRFPKIKNFVREQHRLAHTEYEVRNLFGRKRRLWNAINSGKAWIVAEAERQSVNAPIQGAASDYTLFSSILIWENERYGLLPELKQVYTVHDSLGYLIPPENIHKLVPELSRICENPETKEWFGFEIKDVTMKVDFELSNESWVDFKNYDSKVDY